jgi:hypothetical protein
MFNNILKFFLNINLYADISHVKGDLQLYICFEMNTSS